ncbi:hypothetical protein K2173_004471 [Erythroxylum novogranatense]|uniref:Uncharacterized protein n=1 Tax=Erythroxylum novogranatense TaxID=1862640 RepID=A0AAV8T4K0_9ROSI|nr:hypothetical protein K2173_004471 [Erythroxylum novogranatense]
MQRHAGNEKLVVSDITVELVHWCKAEETRNLKEHSYPTFDRLSSSKPPDPNSGFGLWNGVDMEDIPPDLHLNPQRRYLEKSDKEGVDVNDENMDEDKVSSGASNDGEDEYIDIENGNKGTLDMKSKFLNFMDFSCAKWNYQGAASSKFRRILCNLCKIYHPHLIALLET